MQSCLNGRHDLHVLFHQRQGGTHRSLIVHVRHLHIGDGGEASALFDNVVQ